MKELYNRGDRFIVTGGAKNEYIVTKVTKVNVHLKRIKDDREYVKSIDSLKYYVQKWLVRKEQCEKPKVTKKNPVKKKAKKSTRKTSKVTRK